jgi:hypothetical protein
MVGTLGLDNLMMIFDTASIKTNPTMPNPAGSEPKSDPEPLNQLVSPEHVIPLHAHRQ